LSAELAGWLAQSRQVLVLTGAGMSAESGIPTFRDARSGLWARYEPEDLATPQAFERQPSLVWNWYQERRRQVRKAQPHEGHRVLAWLERRVSRLVVATQNVDGLHQAAGSTEVLELHGNILRSKCHRTLRPISDEWLRNADQEPPASPWAPDGLARPDVVWFGEALPSEVIEQAMAAASSCDFCFSIGTTSLVQPAASLPLVALRRGVPVVEINPEETPLSPHANTCLRAPASIALAGIRRQLERRGPSS
jgi:NAD-dependent deacetylase